MASIEDLTSSGLAPEAALLLATAGGPVMDGPIQRLAARVVNWTRFLQLAAQERAEAIVVQRFKELGVALPAAVDKELKVTALRADLRMARLTQRLEETLRAYQAARLPVVLLKGAALGKTVYGFVPRRPMLDLDLLIPADRRQEALSIALATGWATTPLSQYQDFYNEHHHLPPLVDARSNQFNLELHTGLMPAGHPFAWPI
ncbi:MAG TPA: nucleotidyltransferase family protein, partial [Gemmatimonadales bacterium]|nr:nucleotidyltransferase family protein [Gemmatimonadales bacterium]